MANVTEEQGKTEIRNWRWRGGRAAPGSSSLFNGLREDVKGQEPNLTCFCMAPGRSMVLMDEYLQQI